MTGYFYAKIIEEEFEMRKLYREIFFVCESHVKKDWVEAKEDMRELILADAARASSVPFELVPIKWISQKTYNSYAEAREALMAMPEEKRFAVPYRRLKDNVANSDSKLKELENQRLQIIRELDNESRRFCFENRTDEFVVCPHCQSQFNLEKFRILAHKINEKSSNYCPICGKDMRSENDMRKMHELKATLTAVDTETRKRQEQLARHRDNVERHWLVKSLTQQ